jgi:hypothetical protein
MYKFEDFLILGRKKRNRYWNYRDRYVYIRHSRPHFDEWQDVQGKKHPRHVRQLQSHRSVWSETRRPDWSYNGLLELKFKKIEDILMKINNSIGLIWIPVRFSTEFFWYYFCRTNIIHWTTTYEDYIWFCFITD